MSRKSTTNAPARMTQPPAIRLRDLDLEQWLATQAEPGETLGQTAGRLLRLLRAMLERDGTSAHLADALRDVRDRAETALGLRR